MDVSRKTDYALRMIAELVANEDGVLSVRTAARESGVPYSFARSIQRDLAAAGLVSNSRGAAGGMRLAVDPRKTTLLQVVEAVQGPVTLSCCETSGADGAPCPNRAQCRYASLWCGAEGLLRAYFGSVTLRQLLVEGLLPRACATFELASGDEGA